MTPRHHCHGTNYTYYTPLTNYYNGGAAPPISVANCGSACSASCGGRWDTQLAPFLDTSDSLANALPQPKPSLAQMAYAADGGLITTTAPPQGLHPGTRGQDPADQRL